MVCPHATCYAGIVRCFACMIQKLTPEILKFDLNIIFKLISPCVAFDQSILSLLIMEAASFKHMECHFLETGILREEMNYAW